MPNEGGQCAAVDPWQAANHFFVFLQALVLLGQLWGHDGQGVERVREIRAEGFFRETNPGCGYKVEFYLFVLKCHNDQEKKNRFA